MFECYCIDRMLNPDEKHDCIFTWVNPNRNGQARSSHYHDKAKLVPANKIFVCNPLPCLKLKKSKVREYYT